MFNQEPPDTRGQHLFTCDESNLDWDSLTLGTRAMGAGRPELPPLLLLTPDKADMTVPEPPTTCSPPTHTSFNSINGKFGYCNFLMHI